MDIVKRARLWSVQPLSAPSGKLFYYDFKYETEEEKISRIAEEKRKEREAKLERIF